MASEASILPHISFKLKCKSEAEVSFDEDERNKKYDAKSRSPGGNPTHDLSFSWRVLVRSIPTWSQDFVIVLFF